MSGGITALEARATPAIGGGKVSVGTQGPFGGGGELLAFDESTVALLWATQLESHPAAIVTQSAVIHGQRVHVGVASQEEALAALAIGGGQDPCCSFRGSFLALDIDTGAILWKTWTVPAGYSGGAVRGERPSHRHPPLPGRRRDGQQLLHPWGRPGLRGRGRE